MVRTSRFASSGSDTASRRRRIGRPRAKVGGSTPPRPTFFNPYTRAWDRRFSPLNRNLLVFSLFLIVLGFGFGLYLLSFIGVLILIPALASPSQAPARKAPPQSPQPSQPPRRVSPPVYSPPSPPPAPSPKTEPAAAPPPPMTYMSTSASSSSMPPISYTPALFPSPLIPSLSMMGSAPPPVKAPQEVKREGQDELVEVGAILALLKIVFG